MNYSKTIREYCLKNPGMVFDMSYEREKHLNNQNIPSLLSSEEISKKELMIYLINYKHIILNPEKENFSKY